MASLGDWTGSGGDERVIQCLFWLHMIEHERDTGPMECIQMSSTGEEMV